MKVCKVKGCERQHRAKGYCVAHYLRWKRGKLINVEILNYPNSQSANKNCEKVDCDLLYFAKGLCHNHYEKSRRIPKRSSCKIKSCKKKSKGEYCRKHKARIDAGLSTDLRRRFKFVGENHWSWKGGVSEYPNHSELKRVRKRKLESVNYVCEECNGIATVTHHKDKNKNNHSFKNLKALCHKCHISVYHKGDKWGRGALVPGFTLEKIANMAGCSPGPIWTYLKHKKESKKHQYKINKALNEIICTL